MTVTVNAKLGPHESYSVLRGYFDSRAPVADIIRGPLGSGKTLTSLQRILCQISEQEPSRDGVRRSRSMALRCTYPELETTTIAEAERFFRPFGGIVKRGSPPKLELRFKRGDGVVCEHEMLFLAGLNDPGAEEQFRGVFATWLWANELREIPRAALMMAMARCNRFPLKEVDGAWPTWAGMLADTNSYDVEHWLYKLLEEERPEGWVLHSQPGAVVKVDGRWQVNPHAENLGHLAPGYYERQLAGRPEDWIRVNLGNEYAFSVDGKPVHPEYVDAVHCARDPIPYEPRLPLLLGIDFGRTPAASAWQREPGQGRWLGIAELVTQDMSASLFAPELKRWLDRMFPGARVEAFGDPAGDRAGQTVEITPIAVLRAAGIPCRLLREAARGSDRAALARPMTRLCLDGKPALIISPTMTVTRRGLQGGYCYRRMRIVGAERYTEEPDKNAYSHVVEAGEYALLGAGERATQIEPAFTRGPWGEGLPGPAMAEMD